LRRRARVGIMPRMNETVAIGNLKAHADAEVRVRGWMYGRRSGGKIAFLLLRDGTGTCQSVVEATQRELFDKALALGQESSVALTGRVRVDERAPGGCELSVTGIEVLQAAEGYPISRKSHGIDFLLGNRHLWLRSPRQTAILRIRHTAIRAARAFFDEQGFTLIDTPILSPGAAEGAGTLFRVDYFGEEVFLAQTGQLYLESACMALQKVYCFGPTFRAEKSKTRRHLTEFWMIEPEIAFADLDVLGAQAEGLISRMVGDVLEHHAGDLEMLGRDTGPLQRVVPPFPRITYSDAVDILHDPKTAEWLGKRIAEDQQKLDVWIVELADMEKQLPSAKGWKLENLEQQVRERKDDVRELDTDLAHRRAHLDDARQFAWGGDFGGDEETILSNQFDRPVIVTRYPRRVKAFYMKPDPGNADVVLNMDVLAPEGYGEIVGGSLREDRIEALEARMAEEGMNPEPYAWYLDLRRYGSVPHGGFGLGIERTIAWICGLRHIRETIPFPRLMGRIYP
jgi:asparaginyl-tRNA synthetase